MKLLIILVVSSGVVFGLSRFQSQAPEVPKDPWRVLIGKPAPAWHLNDWINSEPISLSDLKGKVVLIRWWLESCPYCKATAPSLNEFYQKYRDQDFVVVGMYHPKPKGRKVSQSEVTLFSELKSFEFPIAIDQDWQTLHKYWPLNIEMDYTSVSFLLDKEGIIRYIHPGGSYSANGQPFNNPQWEKDYHEIKRNIEALL